MEQPSTEAEDQLPVESFQRLAVDDINVRIAAAVDGGKDWPRDAIRVAQEFLGFTESRSVRMVRQDGSGERPDETTVTVVEDGYRDDSVRGRWTEFYMARAQDGFWRVEEIRQAYRCWRGSSRNSYSRELCP